MIINTNFSTFYSLARRKKIYDTSKETLLVYFSAIKSIPGMSVFQRLLLSLKISVFRRNIYRKICLIKIQSFKSY